MLCSIFMSGKKEFFQDLQSSEVATITWIAGVLVSKETGTFCVDLEDDEVI